MNKVSGVLGWTPLIAWAVIIVSLMAVSNGETKWSNDTRPGQVSMVCVQSGALSGSVQPVQYHFKGSQGLQDVICK